MHPSSTPTRLPRWGPRGWLRCSSFTYSRYAHSSRLAIRAPRRPRRTTNFWDATLTMEITRNVNDGIVDLVVVGRLDGYWADHLDAALTDAIREGHHRLRLDCS